MGPESWMRRIGAEVFGYGKGDEEAEAVADVMTRLYEAGWRGPEVAPRIAPGATKVLWPVGDGHEASITSDGLERYYAGRGSRFYLLRMSQLVRAMAGPLAPRLQEMLAAYEEQCARDGLSPIPPWADWNVFVGGDHDSVDGPALLDGLSSEG